MGTTKKAASTALTVTPSISLTAEQFHRLKKVPAAVEWLQNFTNARTRRVYEVHVKEFAQTLGLKHADQVREVTRAHIIAYRNGLERAGSSTGTIRAKLSALSSLFDYLCERNSIAHNPVKGVKRPKAENPNEGKTPAI